MTPRTVRFEPHALELLAQNSVETGRDQAEIIRMALDAWMEGDSATWHARYQLERAERIRVQKQLTRVREAAKLLQEAPAFTRLLQAVRSGRMSPIEGTEFIDQRY